MRLLRRDGVPNGGRARWVGVDVEEPAGHTNTGNKYSQSFWIIAEAATYTVVMEG